MSETPPAYPGLPLVGNAHQFTGRTFELLESLSDVGEDVVRLDLDGPAAVTVSPAAVRAVLVEEHDAFERADFFVEGLDPLVGEGLLTVDGEEWATQRDVVGPAFFADRIAEYGDVVGTVVEEQFAGDAPGVGGWAAGDRIVVERETREIGVEVVSRSLLGTSMRDRMATVHDVADATIEYYDADLVDELLPAWVPTPTRRRFGAAMADLDDIVDAVLEGREAGSATETAPSPGGDGPDLVSMVLAGATDGRLDRESVRDLVRTFLLAGADTTSLAMASALVLLADHPAVATRLRDELDRELGETDPSAADLADLPYLEAVVDETLRLYPSAFAVYRQATRPVEVAGYAVESGDLVVVPQWALHRDERYFEDPKTFRPERWLAGEPGDPTDEAFFPFGAGPFTCIGNRLATTEARIAVAMAVRRFEFDHVAGDVGHRRAAITTQPVDPLVLEVSERTG